MLRWPWSRAAQQGKTLFCLDEQGCAWMELGAGGRIVRAGLEPRRGESDAELALRVKALHLPPRQSLAMLPLSQTQLVQIDAPKVRPDEMRSAARWAAKELIDGRIEEMIIDVMFVGPPNPTLQRQLLVAAAPNTVIRAQAEFARLAGLDLATIDIAEAVQRNLQTRNAENAGFGERATALLVRHEQSLLLTICAGAELYLARRLPWAGLVQEMAARGAAVMAEPALESLDFVDYGAVPEHESPDATDLRLVVELQRSLDVWERSWPELPLAGLWIGPGEDAYGLQAMLEGALGLQVGLLYPVQALPDLDAIGIDADTQDLLTPLLGAALRTETRSL